MTVEQMMGLSHYEGVVEGNGGGQFENHTVAGVVLADLLLGLGADPEWTVHFKDPNGGSFLIVLGDLNVTEYEMDGSRVLRNDTGAYPLLVWSIDGEGLLPWTGLFTLVLPDNPFIEYRNWTVDMWMRGVIWIEVG